MSLSGPSFLTGAAWTVGAYGLTQTLRVLTNVVLARLLAPEIFGLMLIVNSLRTGFTLISDIGIGQNIIYNKDAERPDFHNTAWTLEIARNLALWVLCVLASIPIASFFQVPELSIIIPVAALSIIITSLASPAKYLLQKRMLIARSNSYEAAVAAMSTPIYIALAYQYSSIWALVFGGLAEALLLTLGSYSLLKGIRPRLFFSREYVREILTFGKWIFLSSIVYFLSMHFDRLYFAKELPLALVGIYGISRTISELLGSLFHKLGNSLLFPLVSSRSKLDRVELRSELAGMRLKVLIMSAVGLALFVTAADWAILLIYDERYHAASWMLPILALGSWFAVLANINESILLGLGKPSYSAFSNGARFMYLALALPVGLSLVGVMGCILLVALADVPRYVPLLIGQRREDFSFGAQDFAVTCLLILLVAVLQALRWSLGFGTSMVSLVS